MEDKESIKEKRKAAFEGWGYSIKRMDLLILSISGAGLYVIMEAFKYSLDHSLSNVWLLKLTGILFALCIVINFISQITGKACNHNYILWCDSKLECSNPPTQEQIIQCTKYDTKSDTCDKATAILNHISIGLMFCGFISLIWYCMITF